MSQSEDQWGAVVNTAMNIKIESPLTNWGTATDWILEVDGSVSHFTYLNAY